MNQNPNNMDAEKMRQAAQKMFSPEVMKDAKDVECTNCSCKVFNAGFMFKKLSALASPSGKDMVIPVQVFQCSECGNINEEFTPKV